MHRIKQTVCVVLAVMLTVFAAGCRQGKDSSDSVPDAGKQAETAIRDRMELLYCASDTLNPYSAGTEINRELCKLIFDPLVKLDNSFAPVYCLAQSAETAGTVCTVTLRDAVFSDGSPVTAADVVHSFNLAKASATTYAVSLSSALSASAADGKTIVFNIAKGDPYFVNLLDFPILKAGSETRRDEDSVLLPPIGCGRFSAAPGSESLLRNDSYYGGVGSVAMVSLTNAPDEASVSHYIEVGAVDMYYNDISDGKITRMSGKKVDINLNSLVYIGMNDSVSGLSSKTLRYALSSALDRKKICSGTYYNSALPATGFFSPVFKDTKAVQNIQSFADNEITIENLEKIGYNNLNAANQRINSAGQPLKLTLLVNSENRIRATAAQAIAAQLGEAGIAVTVIEKSYPDYLASLQGGHFQLYLGECLITANMDLTNLVLKGGSVAYGIGLAPEQGPDENSETPVRAADVIGGFYAGTNTITDVASILQTEMPVIPVAYRTGVLFYNKNIENVKNSSASDIYFSIEEYTIRKP